MKRTQSNSKTYAQAGLRWLILFILLGTGIFMGSLAATPARADTNYALSFDGGTNYVNLGLTSSLFGSTSWTATKTVSLWVLPDLNAPPAPANYPPSGETIFNSTRPLSFGLTRANFNSLDRLWVWNADSSVISMLPLNYTPGVWTHIAIVHEAGTLSVYQDGVFVNSISTGSTATSSGYLYLGGSGGSNPANYFQGQIDELRFWDTALSPATIAAWMSREIDPTHPNFASLKAYYRMVDGTGTTLTDDSGFGHPGSLLGGMSNANWVVSTAFDLPTPTPTFTSLPATDTPTATPLPPTNTPAPPSSTPTNTSAAPSDTPTATAVPPTNTPAPPSSTPTNTSAAPTNTPTATSLPPTNTPTATAVPPTATSQPPSPTPSPTPPSSGGQNYALSFDGNNDFVQLNETASMLGPGWETTKTVEMWVKPAGTGKVCAYQNVGKCDAIFGDRPRWWGIARGVLNGEDRIWFWNFDGTLDLVGVPYVPDQWLHIAMVHADGVIHVYLNGIEVVSFASGATLQPNTGAKPVLHIGGIVNSSSAYWPFEGLIDEVRLWNIPRSTTEVLQDMNHTLTGSEAGLKAYYQMSDGSGLVLTDDSQYNWDGALFDGARGVPPDGSPPQWVASDAFGSVP